jgi:NADPH-dependent curcumin reductase CurA
MSATRNRQVLLADVPKSKLGLEHFELTEAGLPKPADGEVLVRVRLISLDAANRAWMQGATYRSAVTAGSVMAGGAVGEVLDSRAPNFSPGDLVFGDTGWQEYASVPAKALSKMPKLEPMTHLISVYGVAGLTAYFGLLEIGKPKPSETVVVSAAAGCRHCWWRAEMRLAPERARLRWRGRLQRRRSVQDAENRGAKRRRRLFRQCRRRHL